MRRVYLDHNASSPMSEEVREVLASAMAACAGNPSSPHREGQNARRVLEQARGEIAALLGVRPGEVVFTSGGTESNNAAIEGAVAGFRKRAPRSRARVIASEVEHPSVLAACERLGRHGVETSLLPVDGAGRVDPAALECLLREAPAALVSVMHANNETGVVQPVEEIAAIAEAAGVPLHCDAAQSAGKIPIRPIARRAQFLSLAAHKLGGPPGVGALVVKEGAAFEPILEGGPQERRRRAGTEPAALAAAFARAASFMADPSAGAQRLEPLRHAIERALPAMDGGCRIHGAGAARLSNTTHFYLPSAPGRVLVLQLDRLGFAVSTGSACSSGSSRPSHVLAAMGCPEREGLDSLRVSMGPGTTETEIMQFIEAMEDCVRKAGIFDARASAAAEVA